MNELLTRLGVPPALQAWFDCEKETVFDYGGAKEIFAAGFHKVPTTVNLWLGGNRSASEVVITHSVMEAIAFLTLHAGHYPRRDTLSFIATGNLPGMAQLQWIRQNFKKRKFTLVFGNDLLGALTDIKVAAGLKGQDTRLLLTGDDVRIQMKTQMRILSVPQVSLYAFEKAFGLRMGIRTRKPPVASTFLDQLKYGQSA
ncbi:hypothetical protein MUGA111182_10330 [Mucilaginibacter galii]|uniref:Uncharacterized protein n=1 Tax=Mucilaginibacter galii TaxID=2005073 RepID=A0A917J9F5_9SPHI|nr:hypothetical protein [Mucilaginibacter galii]GGI51084.1 hypothetical protein GCM10011425_22960 [Mucilaginibacter galii]